mmetsp:Transcript_124945/g.347878  ORF Transcript_124945/g.347878 Transcript_124945/m.347878 type:complete len:322 (-) Transcript_124945:300-1265(-)
MSAFTSMIVATCTVYFVDMTHAIQHSGRVPQEKPLDTVREKGYHSHETCESPILAHSAGWLGANSNFDSFLVCVPYKNGWGWWSTVICDFEGHGRACHQGYHNKTQALDYLWWRHSEGEITAIYQDSTLPKIKLVRNPITRVLAAWLTWVTERHPGDYNYVEDSFEDFVRNSMMLRSNCHWSRQIRHCGEDEGVSYELLKVEDRHLWGPGILARFGLLSAAKANGGIQTGVNHHCPGHACSATPLVTKYYNRELVLLVKQHYSEEIARYNYTSDFQKWEDTIVWAFEDRARLGRQSNISLLQAKLDLEMLDKVAIGFTDLM